ncbi:MAG: hypothetical protein DRN20_01715 [Thermoplasmata archaeon]|nr:MAG: hypothetical protein DRN20_01715 [Thermoplasmata archaeon]
MDFEYVARKLYRSGAKMNEIVQTLKNMGADEEFSRALLEEISNSENINDSFVGYVCNYPKSEVSATEAGVGCRGMGDFYVHRKIAEIIGRTSAIIDPSSMDDGGAVISQAGDDKKIVVAVDGMHSRLGNFPFLGGFHAARAALRDIVVMGAEPLALFADVHLGTEGDVGKIFDYTAGISAVADVLNVPLVSGSTLRIGGDLVVSDRLMGSVGAVGLASKIVPRNYAREGDVILMSLGCGGGTITTAAIFHGWHEVVKITLNLDFFKGAIPLVRSDFITKLHSMTDVTNGGIRGDAHEISEYSGKKIVLDYEALRMTVHPKVLEMLDALDIDFMGVSTDSLLIIVNKKLAKDVASFVEEHGLPMFFVGEVREGHGVYLKKDGKEVKMMPEFREAPYTPVKRVVGTAVPKNWERAKRAIDDAAIKAVEKRKKIKELLFGK